MSKGLRFGIVYIKGTRIIFGSICLIFVIDERCFSLAVNLATNYCNCTPNLPIRTALAVSITRPLIPSSSISGHLYQPEAVYL